MSGICVLLRPSSAANRLYCPDSKHFSPCHGARPALTLRFKFHDQAVIVIRYVSASECRCVWLTQPFNVHICYCSFGLRMHRPQVYVVLIWLAGMNIRKSKNMQTINQLGSPGNWFRCVGRWKYIDMSYCLLLAFIFMAFLRSEPSAVSRIP